MKLWGIRSLSWLAYGLDGRSPKTIKKNQNVLQPILTVIGARKLRDLTAADVRQTLAAMAAGYSNAAVTMGTSRSSAPSGTPKPTTSSSATSPPWLTPPKASKAAPSKSLTLDQAIAVIAAARTLPVMELRPGLKDVRRPAALMHAYIVLSLLAGIRTGEARDPAALSASPWRRFRRCVPGWTARPVSGSRPGTTGTTPGSCLPPAAAPPWMRGTSARCSNASAPKPGLATAGPRASCGPHSSA